MAKKVELIQFIERWYLEGRETFSNNDERGSPEKRQAIHDPLS